MTQKYVFISYSSKNQFSANELRSVLEKNDISCWMAPESIPPGSNYLEQIPKAIANCEAFVLILSKESQESEWVSSEIETAKNYKKTIIPFQIDASPLTTSFEFLLTHYQRIMALNRRNEAYKELFTEIYHIVHQTRPISKPKPVPSSPKRFRGGWLLILLVVLAFAVMIKNLPKEAQHVHVWEPATCISPKTCSECGETAGSLSDHVWNAATCTSPKICRYCGVTDGYSLGHQWTDTSYNEPKICSVCGQTDDNPMLDIAVGDTITMGNYGGEDIVWIVLEYDLSTNQALLISKYCLEVVPFHTGGNYGSWENSNLRRWLNNEFLSKAFSQKERTAILEKQISTANNPDFGTSSGNDTTDRIFVLSIDEVSYYFPSKTSRQTEPTAYCRDQGCYDPVKYAQEHGTDYEQESVGFTCWWLRTAGLDTSRTANVFASGTVSAYGAIKSSDDVAVRPAMWVQFG